MVIFLTLSVFELQSQFTNINSYLSYLIEIKWKNGYQYCKRGYKQYTKRYHPFAWRYKICRYDESATATLYSIISSSIYKSILWYLSLLKKEKHFYHDLAKETRISQPTAWLFHCKIQQLMQSSGKHSWIGEIHIDEYPS